jgi:hypothetical protein
MKVLALLCFGLLLSACDGEPIRSLVVVEKNQPGYIQVPKLIEYVMLEADRILATCGPGVHGCLKETDTVAYIICDTAHELECKAHEMDHIVYGPLHEVKAQ